MEIFISGLMSGSPSEKGAVSVTVNSDENEIHDEEGIQSIQEYP